MATEFGPDASGLFSLYPADLDPASGIAASHRSDGPGDRRRAVRMRSAEACPRDRTDRYAHLLVFVTKHQIDALSVGHVIHGVESNILFGNNYAPPVFLPHVLNATDLTLHSAMARYWKRFAATGNPNRGGDGVFVATIHTSKRTRTWKNVEKGKAPSSR